MSLSWVLVSAPDSAAFNECTNCLVVFGMDVLLRRGFKKGPFQIRGGVNLKAYTYSV